MANPDTTTSSSISSDSSTWQQDWDDAILGNYPTPPIQLVSGAGEYVTDSEGRRYLDLLSGIAVNALGHAHPAIVEAVTQQISTLGHTSNLHAQPQTIRLAQRLKQLLIAGIEQQGGADAASGEESEQLHLARGAKVFFSNSGAEANEAAFKIARATGRSRILAATHGFHGRTMGALALTGQPAKQEPFRPLPSGVEFYPYGDAEALRARVLDTELGGPDSVAAIFLEPIQGETGVIPAPEGFLTQVRQLCDEHGILMVVDEVQTGIGRTGSWFAFQHEGILPDVVTLAKGLGGGLPIGATIALPAAQLIAPGMHGTTFGGNPVVSAAALAVLDTIEGEGLLNHVRAMGEKLRAALESHSAVELVRGRGLMLGVVLKQPLQVQPLDYGVIVNQPQPNVIRLVPPLSITNTAVDEAIATLTHMLDDHEAKVG